MSNIGQRAGNVNPILGHDGGRPSNSDRLVSRINRPGGVMRGQYFTGYDPDIPKIAWVFRTIRNKPSRACRCRTARFAGNLDSGGSGFGLRAVVSTGTIPVSGNPVWSKLSSAIQGHWQFRLGHVGPRGFRLRSAFQCRDFDVDGWESLGVRVLSVIGQPHGRRNDFVRFGRKR
jgi:hypothetical protein